MSPLSRVTITSITLSLAANNALRRECRKHKLSMSSALDKLVLDAEQCQSWERALT